MLELHQFDRGFGLPNGSPFCMKVETYLRLADIPYEMKVVTNPAKGPHGKAPWIVDDGRTIADSRFIIDYLDEKHGAPLKGDHDNEELARHHALMRMLEESTYFIILHERWLSADNAPITRDGLLKAIPNPMRKLVFAMAQRGVNKSLYGQGTGRLNQEEMECLGKRDVDCLSHVLKDQPYFGGDKPALIDTVAFATIANLIVPPTTSKVNDHARGKDNLVAYSGRMMYKIFPEFTAD